jgi:hypothetical protein
VAHIDELVRAHYFVSLAGAPAVGDVFGTLGFEHQGRAVGGAARPLGIFVDETFDVELPQDYFLFCAVETEVADVLMDFTLRVLLLRRIDSLVRAAEKFSAEHEVIVTFSVAPCVVPVQLPIRNRTGPMEWKGPSDWRSWRRPVHQQPGKEVRMAAATRHAVFMALPPPVGGRTWRK